MLKEEVKKRLLELKEHLEFCSIKYYGDEFRLLDDEKGHIMSFYTEKQFIDWTSKFMSLNKELKNHLSIDFEDVLMY